ERVTPALLRNLIKRRIEKLNGASRARRVLERTFLFMPAEIRDLYFDNFAVYSPSRQRRLFTAEAYARMRDRDPYRASLAHIEQSDAETLLDKLLAADLKTYLHELLMKQDQMSMAASLETRVPFLDHKLVEFATRLPEKMKLRGWTTKYVLRRAMRGVLPPQILTRKKMGFPVPIGSWFRGPFRQVVEEYVLSERALERGVFNPSYVRELVARHAAGENHAERLWMLVNFEIWQRRFFDGEASGVRPALKAVSGRGDFGGVVYAQ
ncbi:MAG TPA: asparagine synthase C-terminal domain-containing protein, partial [Blastocatellia bacterium]|nr:asparagine synthase C-terminal domain-containing protein [Blastocatellia bacterium]